MRIFISTKQENWRQDCQEHAQTRKAFELHGIDKNHHLFIHSLCAAHPYKYDLEEKKVIFSPLHKVAPFSYRMIMGNMESNAQLRQESKNLLLEIQGLMEAGQVLLEEAWQNVP